MHRGISIALFMNLTEPVQRCSHLPSLCYKLNTKQGTPVTFELLNANSVGFSSAHPRFVYQFSFLNLKLSMLMSAPSPKVLSPWLHRIPEQKSPCFICSRRTLLWKLSLMQVINLSPLFSFLAELVLALCGPIQFGYSKMNGAASMWWRAA